MTVILFLSLWFWGSLESGRCPYGLPISNFLGYSQMVAAPGASFYADCWPTLPLGAFCQNTPSVWPGSLTIWPLGSKRGSASSSPAQASEGMGIPHRPSVCWSGSFRDQIPGEGIQSTTLWWRWSKDLGVTLKK